MKKFLTHISLILLCLIFSNVNAQSPDHLIERFIITEGNKGLAVNKDVSWKITGDHISSTSGVHHIYFIQTYEGIPIIGTESSIHLKGQQLVADHYNFFTEFSGRRKISASPKIDAITALEKAVISLGKVPKEKFRMIASSNEDELRISGGGLFDKTITPELNFIVTESSELSLVWNFNLRNTVQNESWSILIDTNNGDIVETNNQILWCEIPEPTETEVNEFIGPLNYKEENNSCTQCYEVYELPVENPYYGERTIVEQPWHALASPYGWHDLNGEPGADHTRTFGNNVFLKTYGGHITEGSELLNFTGFPLDTIINDQQRWEDAASTNAFYIMNSIHDIFYIYGFNEEARNFQKNNYGRGGLDDDPAQVFIQVDDSGCGSSYEYTEDGASPTIRLGICGSKDAAVDADVVIHEYVHGLSTRLIFAGDLFACLNNRENLGEGISDWYSKVLTIKPEETRDDHQGFGNYVQGKGPDGIGTNLYHYSTDMRVNPLTYGDITNYPYSYHKIGAVWATMLWEITWNFIDEYGFDPNVYNFTGTQADAGNIRAIAIVTEAMKLMPCRPGFVSGRDAIITANKQLYGGYGECLIWDGFAKRGVGLYADEGEPDLVGDEIEDFTTMPREIEFDFVKTLCLNTGFENYKGGLPYGGVYSGEGVFDHGDGKSFHIYTVGLEEGVYEVLYTIESTDCHTASSALGYYEIIEDTVAPVPTCLEEITQVIEIQEEYLLWDYTGSVEIDESCSLVVEVTQDPPPQTIVEPGIIPLKFTLVDESGNESYCETILNLIELEEVVEEDYNFAMTPNPTSGRVYLKNLTGELMRSATIYDMLGRTVLYFDLSATQHETELVVESLVQGVYFVKFEFDKAEIIKQLVKK